MNLLEDIQNAAVDGSSDLGTLLRKCKVLASRLGSEPLENWLIWESNGYPDDVPVPDYRIWPLPLKGHFSGPFQSDLRNASIPWMTVPKEFLDKYRNYNFRQSVAGVENLVNNNEKDVIKIGTGDLAVKLGTNVYEYLNCLECWGQFSTNELVELLNAVRNKVLDFILAVKKEKPDAGEHQDDPAEKMNPARVTQIFNTTVYGGAANILGTANHSTITYNITAGDFSSLKSFLLGKGVSSEDVEELSAALKDEPKQDAPGEFGHNVSSWVGEMVAKAAARTWDIGVAVAGNLLTTAINSYYGLS